MSFKKEKLPSNNSLKSEFIELTFEELLSNKNVSLSEMMKLIEIRKFCLDSMNDLNISSSDAKNCSILIKKINFKILKDIRVIIEDIDNW